MADDTISTRRIYALGLLGALLMYLCWYPFDQGYLAWVALVPLFLLVRIDRWRKRFYVAMFASAVAYYLPTLSWIRVAHPMMYLSWIGLTLYCASWQVCTIALIRQLLARRVPLTLAAPLVWTFTDYLRAHFPTGFSWLEPLGLRHLTGFGWYFPGYSQHGSTLLMQCADIAGVYGLTFLVVLVNATLTDAVRFGLHAMQKDDSPTPAEPLAELVAPRPPRLPVRAIATALSLLALAMAYGYYRLGQTTTTPGPTVALIQTNLEQEVKMDKGEDTLASGKRLCDEACFPTDRSPRPDLVVWPETTFPIDWVEITGPYVAPNAVAGAKKYREKEFDPLAIRWKTDVLLGLNSLDRESDARTWLYNSALLLRKGGGKPLRYDKMHLVPFGEYVPMGETLPFLQFLTPYRHDYSCKPGERRTRFPLEGAFGKTSFGVLICYEDSDPSLARRYLDGDPVGFLVNISNDGWFRGSAEHEEHLAICRFRAVECRRSVVRAVNMGVSAVIDSNGRILALPVPDVSASKSIEAIVRGTVPIDDRKTLYCLLGDWLPMACGVAVLVCLRRNRNPIGSRLSA